MGTCNPSLVRQNAYQNYNEALQWLSKHQELEEPNDHHLEIPFQRLVQAQTFGLHENGAAYETVIRKCFNELDSVSSLILVPLFDVIPASLLTQELTRLAHVVTKANDSFVLLSFLKALLSCQSDFKKKNMLINVLDKCWLLNQKQMSPLFLK